MDSSRVERLQWGVIAGAGAFALGLVAAFVLLGTPADGDPVFSAGASGEHAVLTWGDLGSQRGPSRPAAYEVAGWLYHEAHLASIDASLSVRQSSPESAPGSRSLRFAAEVSALRYAIPPIVVGAAGYWVADQFPADGAVEAATDGAHVAVGYCAAATLSVFLLSWESTAGGQWTFSAGPDLVTGVVLTGVVYPVVVGGLGGYVGYAYGDGGT